VSEQHIGPYELEGLLGEGGIGQVYAARDTVLGRRVAIKMLRPELAHDRELVDRFYVEAKSLGNLTHPNITTIYALHTEGSQTLMVMELVEGETLDAILVREHRLGLRYAMAILAQTIAGLGYAHRMGIVHRDLKPANLMVNAGGLVKIMDFGIAKIQGSQLTRTGIFQGTLSFASPEQITAKAVDERSDQYSLAVVAYKMLSGNAPFVGDSEYALMTAHLQSEPAPLADDVPAPMRAAVMRALAKRPEDRFPSIGEFGRALGTTAILGEAIDIVQRGVAGAAPSDADDATRSIQLASVRARAARPPSEPAKPQTAPARSDDSAAWPAPAPLGHNEPSVSMTGAHSAAARPALGRRRRGWLPYAALGGVAVAAAVGVGAFLLLPRAAQTPQNAQRQAPSVPAPGQSASALSSAKSTTPAPPAPRSSPAAAGEPHPIPPPSREPPAPAAAAPSPSPAPAPAARQTPPANSVAETQPAREAPAPPQPSPPAPQQQPAQATPGTTGGQTSVATVAPPLAPPAPPPEGEATWSLDQKREVQQALRALGGMQGDANGNFGPQTRTAITEFQAFQGDPETGALTEDERRQLIDMTHRLTALLETGAASPSGVTAVSLKGGEQRLERAAAAEAAGKPAEAAYWYRLAAADGEAKAFTNLGTLMVRGQGVDKPDPAAARLLWLAGAARGEAVAMFDLGAMYERGIGIAADKAIARKWYERAAAHGHAQAREALKRLAS